MKSPRSRYGAGREPPSIVHEVLSAPGQPLNAATRAFFEVRFGYDFHGVRIHADTKAAESTTATNALAYTVGEHIALAANRYQPETDRGRRLLAHELAHVVQQDSSRLARQPSPPTPTPQSVIDDANSSRLFTLANVLSELDWVIDSVQGIPSPSPGPFTFSAIQNWLFVNPSDPAFVPSVHAAQQLYLKNVNLMPRLFYQSSAVQVDPAGNACPPNFAYSRGGVAPVYICDNFIAAGPGCQRDVMIHEHFHLLGLLLPGVDYPAGQREPTATTATQALGNPDSLSQMAAEIADGPHTPCCTGAC